MSQQETKREKINRMRQTEKELSKQVNRNEITPERGDAMARIGGLIKDKE